MGVIEIVEKILDAFLVAIQEEDTNGKNIVLLAKKEIIKKNAFWKLDNQGHNPSSLIPGATLQMQYEIKWYKEHFTKTHKKLGKRGSKWLIKTSKACFVFAMLIANVAFAASTTVSGVLNEDYGRPILLEEIAFHIFAISLLVYLCFLGTTLI
ncbi:hypothetical protein CICLE_v10006488mg, partial [Citrus x clementina]